MINQQLVNDWGYEEFVIYLYLCVADADYNLKKNEIDLLLEKVMYTLGGSRNRYKSKLDKIFLEFTHHNDNDKIQVINEKAKTCKKSESEKIIEDLGNAMKQDHMHKSVEMIMFRFIRKTLNRISSD
ncbi:MAG: hypothetical protein IIA88_04190 [Bacteroidetes bacterium]|nr:hypothetical protein [Bacteroidota bacterium]